VNDSIDLRAICYLVSGSVFGSNATGEIRTRVLWFRNTPGLRTRLALALLTIGSKRVAMKHMLFKTAEEDHFRRVGDWTEMTGRTEGMLAEFGRIRIEPPAWKSASFSRGDENGPAGAHPCNGFDDGPGKRATTEASDGAVR
jgi:hypothetical protein